MPFITSKKELCVELGFVSPVGRMQYYKLRLVIFTNAMLEKMELTEDEYKKLRTFNLQQSKIIRAEITDDLK